ncbi:2,3-bisphosphoglycerate-dependent phosphoglycerate mutase [Secundilactobacillus folii]|uniref:2,3-bisphosphoglycerate-dependent phosphoglycerate mutase n=1 Tax=Secundilactobacillus folii TaxID=2678357 RepID=A0A7X2XVL9_9LACO|nr:2,3-diphosphoglycerate-dependent phosphoglycerate mutase [Secundilactobacillus folii]MTV82370.1 2,3-bisphosphoglycerate-dependent phosphoglycerate mutase [Secundilactobacillus folii]
MVKLVILRHGESQANRDGVFTGWSDVALTEKGIEQAHAAGKIISHTGIQFEHLHTSMLKRAIMTANIVLEEAGQLYLPVTKSWRLNERHYGALRGLKKAEVKAKVGEKQFKLWRRSYKVVPPLLEKPDQDSRYEPLGVTEPLGESLAMAYDRLMPYWQDEIAPRLLDGHNQLVVAHGSTLRALIKYIERINDHDIDALEVPNGVPIEYEFDQQLSIVDKKTLD